MTSSSCFSLPNELIDLIIDNLYSDKQTLTTCSLIAHAWLPSSRYHLFEQLKLDKTNLDAFLGLLRSPHMTIAPFIRHLSLNVAGIVVEKEWSLRAVRRLKSLMSVKTVVLRGLTNMKGFGGQVQKRLIPGLPALEELELRYNHLKSFDQVADLLYSCTKLQKLSLHEVEWENAGSVTNPTPAQRASLPAHLHTLDISHCDKTRLLSWYMSHDRAAPPIHTVNFHTLTAEELPAVGQFLGSLGTSLQNLELKFRLDSVVNEDEVSEHVNLTPNTSLRSLCIVNRGMFTQTAFTGPSHVPAILSQINSENIEEVQLWLYVMQDFHTFCWSGIAELFERPQFRRLKSLRFWMLGSMDKDEASESIRERLASCDKRDILKFN